MVQNPRTAARARRIQPVDLPAPLTVETDARGRPAAVTLRRRLEVVAITARWRIDDEWWRERPVHRDYYELLLEDGATLTVFRDGLTHSWYRQRYA